MANRELIPILLFNAQAVFSNRLFDPETKDLGGKLLDKPSFSVNLRFPKTKANWTEEPALRSFVEACKTIYLREMAGMPANRVEFPIKDGDIPNNKGKTPDWAKGHWVIRASSTYKPTVEQMVSGVKTELPSLSMGAKKIWHDGDYVAAALSIAKRLNDNIGIRCYLNSILFTGKGEEIATGGGASVDWNAALEDAKAQGIHVNQDAPAAGGFNPGFQAGPGPQGFNPGFQPAPGPSGGFNPGFQPGPAPQENSFNPSAGPKSPF